MRNNYASKLVNEQKKNVIILINIIIINKCAHYALRMMHVVVCMHRSVHVHCDASCTCTCNTAVYKWYGVIHTPTMPTRTHSRNALHSILYVKLQCALSS